MIKDWVSVETGLPEIGEEVYTYNVNGGLRYHILFLSDDGQWYDQNMVENAMYDNPPTHWCKIVLPRPPECD